MKKIITKKNPEGTIFHYLGDLPIECSGQDCKFCKQDIEIKFTAWENSVPFKILRKGKKYKNPIVQKHRGKAILEICYTCKSVPCYICRRWKCDQWMKEEDRKGQEQGCAFWENERCNSFSCELGIIRKHWRE